jgi:glycosyltransferase involved in cell wall biosynthesis
MDYRVVLGHPFGNENVRQALLALQNEGALEAFVTTVCAEHFPLAFLLPPLLRREVERRSFKCLDPRQIRSHPLLEALRILGSRLPGIASLMPTADDVYHSFNKHLAVEMRRSKSQNLAVYTYDYCAYVTFSVFPNVPKFYELPIGYSRAGLALLAEECVINPEWAATITGLADSEEKLERKDVELELADRIIVPSEFVKSTLPMKWEAKTTIVEYGCPPPALETHWEGSESGPLKVLFCGSLSQRKGISYLFDAARRMGRRIELTVIGSEVAPCDAVRRSLAGVTWHRSLTHAEVLEIMRTQDVFVFPTLFEGRALVVLEALSQGLPVITTANSGATDAVIHGGSGFVVPIRSTDAIVDCLEKLDADRSLLKNMKAEALAIASTITWASYRRNLIAALALHTAS